MNTVFSLCSRTNNISFTKKLYVDTFTSSLRRYKGFGRRVIQRVAMLAVHHFENHVVCTTHEVAELQGSRTAHASLKLEYESEFQREMRQMEECDKTR